LLSRSDLSPKLSPFLHQIRSGVLMSVRPTVEAIESLRATLQKLEENFASVEHEPVLAELKRLLLLRIAQLEAIGLFPLTDDASAIPVPTIPGKQPAEVKILD